MPVPYEPVIRHAWTPGDITCQPCFNQLPNKPCGTPWCGCVCNTPPVLLHIPEDWDDRDAPEPHEIVAVAEVGSGPLEWTEPPTPPESIGTWNVPKHLLGVETVTFNRERYFRLDKALRAGGVLAAVLQVFIFYLVTSRDTEGTWAEVVVIVGCVLTAAYLLATALVRPVEWRGPKRDKSA